MKSLITLLLTFSLLFITETTFAGGKGSGRKKVSVKTTEVKTTPKAIKGMPAEIKSIIDTKKTYTGPRGGKYHLSPSGKKVYEKKKKK
jgi:hypothetical protein